MGNGAWIENKKQTLTFHYRDVPEADQAALKAQAFSIIESYGYLASSAHAAVEAKPPVVWNKGKIDTKFICIIKKTTFALNRTCFIVGEAALYILREEFGENWPEKVKVIFAGDDTTDEDAMRVLYLFISFFFWFCTLFVYTNKKKTNYN